MRYGLLLSYLLLITACDGLSGDERQWLIEHSRKNLVFVEGGDFIMGDVGYIDESGRHQPFKGSADTYPLRKVTLSSYSMQTYEVTFKEFDLYTKDIGEERIYLRYGGDEDPIRQPNFPAHGMTWHQARDYCLWLGELTGLPFSLPTEAQWEYAARSRGQAVAYATDNGRYESGRNMKVNSENKYQMPVGSWPPNPLGLYDMTGNVQEWVLDFYVPFYPYEDEVDPTGPPEFFYSNIMEETQQRTTHISRGGGSVFSASSNSYVYTRVANEAHRTGQGIGLRCVVNQTRPVEP